MDKTSNPMLTTVDNPFDPFSQFKEWFSYDMEKGYNTCGILARVAHTSNSLTDEENILELEIACNEIIRVLPDLYKKVYFTQAA